MTASIAASPRRLRPARRRITAPPSVSRSSTTARVASMRGRSEEHTSELQSLMRISYAVFCLKKKTDHHPHERRTQPSHHISNIKYQENTQQITKVTTHH